MSRGIIQISAFVDAILASFLPEGAVVALTYAQSLSLFFRSASLECQFQQLSYPQCRARLGALSR